MYHINFDHLDRHFLANSADPDQTAPKEQSDQGLQLFSISTAFFGRIAAL